MPDKQKCFIIAPIATPPERIALYRNDPDHCKHVIEHLLVPAVEKAGLQAIAPSAKGAELIHAEIVSKLQDASLVLCDMSGLNPNVFFELGIRTAMNKSVCIIRDETTERTPFDMAPINNHTYSSDLSPWIVPKEIESLSAHIKQSIGATDNALWKYFGLRIKAESAEQPPGPEGKLDLLVSEVDALRKQLQEASRDQDLFHRNAAQPISQEMALDLLVRKALHIGMAPRAAMFGPNGTLILDVEETSPIISDRLLRKWGNEVGFPVQIRKVSTHPKNSPSSSP